MTEHEFWHADNLFAPLDGDLHLERVAGGNETEVYRTDDHRYVVKVKNEEAPLLDDALAEARLLKETADAVCAVIGPEHSIASYLIIARDSQGRVQPVVVQPYLPQASPLFDVDYRQLSRAERARLAGQLLDLMRRAERAYRQQGFMPDLYGRSSSSPEERRRLNAPNMLPWRLWRFVVRRHLLRSRNLMLLPESGRLVLVDYDPIRRGPLYRFLYYNARRLLFLRDIALVLIMRQTGWAAWA